MTNLPTAEEILRHANEEVSVAYRALSDASDWRRHQPGAGRQSAHRRAGPPADRDVHGDRRGQGRHQPGSSVTAAIADPSDHQDRGALTMKTIETTEAAELFEALDYEHGSMVSADDEVTAAGPWVLVGSQHVRTARWEEVYFLVVADRGSGERYGLEYREGLTEEQETIYPWEGKTAPLALTRLYPHTVTMVEYRTKPAEVTA